MYCLRFSFETSLVCCVKRIGRKVFTVREVVSEVRDKATRARLQVLPYELLLREPTADNLLHG